jgi:3-oxoacyl-[acyl-carrier protein] reductase
MIDSQSSPSFQSLQPFPRQLDTVGLSTVLNAGFGPQINDAGLRQVAVNHTPNQVQPAFAPIQYHAVGRGHDLAGLGQDFVRIENQFHVSIPAPAGGGVAAGNSPTRVDRLRWIGQAFTQNVNNELTGKIALVTGGSRGIGRASALALAKAGAEVAVNFQHREAEAQAACREIEGIGRRALPVKADVSNAAEVARLVETVEHALGGIDILVNNAGISRPQSLAEITERDWDEILAVNLKSMFLVTQAVLPGMRQRKWGRIINLSSVAAQSGGVIGPHYAASKAGAIGLTHSYAFLLAKERITANAVASALIETEMNTGNLKARPDLVPMGGFGKVEKVADAVVMLASNVNITGQTISVNGGWHMT